MFFITLKIILKLFETNKILIITDINLKHFHFLKYTIYSFKKFEFLLQNISIVFFFIFSILTKNDVYFQKIYVCFLKTYHYNI